MSWSRFGTTSTLLSEPCGFARLQHQQCRTSDPNCEADDAKELGLCSFCFPAVIVCCKAWSH
jgi:hypothetical protein